MLANSLHIPAQYIQGTPEWHALRKTKITATDSCVIMGASHWKTRIQLYHEKLSDELPMPPTPRMQRGIDLEPLARDLFNLKTGWNMQPEVLIDGWRMASLDGRDADTGAILEIKCPGEKDHAIAISGKVPDHYYPQLQHQIYLAQVQVAWYFSFDGIDGVVVTVKRDDEYIEKMIAEEFKFYKCLRNKIPPEPSEDDYIERDDHIWEESALKYKSLTHCIETLEKEKEEIKKRLIFLSGETNTKGAGISLCQVTRKGHVDYPKIPELNGIDLEPYRKGSIISWRITT